MIKRIILVFACLSLVAVLSGKAGAASRIRTEHVICGQLLDHSVRIANDLLDCPGNGLNTITSGITIDLGDHRIDGIRDDLTVGVLVQADNVTVRGGVVTDFTHGLWAVGSHIRFIGNQSSSNKNMGIILSATSSLVRGATVTDNDGPGIYQDAQGAGNVIANNVVISNSTTGIWLNGASGVLVRGNTSSWNAGQGIDLADSTENTIVGNRTYGNAAAGIRLADGGTSNTLTGNRSYANGGDGILILSEMNTLRSNRATSNTLAGISITGGDATTLIRNVASENGFHGIVSDTQYVTLRQNTANYNGFLNGQDDGIGRGISAPQGTNNSGNVARGNDDLNECYFVDINCYQEGHG